MFLDCDWSISAQLIPNRSAKICNKTIPVAFQGWNTFVGFLVVPNGNGFFHECTRNTHAQTFWNM